MQSITKKYKVVYSDNKIDKGIIGEIITEDDFFIIIRKDIDSSIIKIGKKAIVSIKEVREL